VTWALQISNGGKLSSVMFLHQSKCTMPDGSISVHPSPGRGAEHGRSARFPNGIEPILSAWCAFAEKGAVFCFLLEETEQIAPN
jgi:hypothetical protein